MRVQTAPGKWEERGPQAPYFLARPAGQPVAQLAKPRKSPAESKAEWKARQA